MMYLGSSVDLLASYSFSAIRSSCTKCVEIDEVGKVLALLYSVESIIPIFMTQVMRRLKIRQITSSLCNADLCFSLESDLSSSRNW